MINASNIAHQYIAAWNEQNAERRHSLVADVFTDDASYTDPLANIAGHDGISALIGAVQQQFAGHRFALHGSQDGHNNVIRFSWSLAADGAAPVAYGTDVATVGEDGRLQKVIGFLDTFAGQPSASAN